MTQHRCILCDRRCGSQSPLRICFRCLPGNARSIRSMVAKLYPRHRFPKRPEIFRARIQEVFYALD